MTVPNGAVIGIGQLGTKIPRKHKIIHLWNMIVEFKQFMMNGVRDYNIA